MDLPIAAAARHSRVVAQQVCGAHRVHRYAYGGSGDAYRTIAGAENTDETWDGFVPHVVGSPAAMPNVFSVRMHAQRVLRHRLDGIVDALDPAALAEITAMRFPPRAWVGHRTTGMHAFTARYGGMRLVDPGHFEDFWTLTGYLRADPGSSVRRDRIRHSSGIVAVIRGSRSGTGSATNPGSRSRPSALNCRARSSPSGRPEPCR